jgi:hypothetical protein
MATTGRLTAAQRTAIQAGNPIRQVWYIHVPIDAAHTGYTAVLIHRGIFPTPPASHQRVIRAGQRSHVVWNPTPNVKSIPKAVRYSFTVDNSDGIFFENSADNIYLIPTVYQAVPQECYIRHQLYVAVYSSTGISWSILSGMTFEGVVSDLRHEDTADAQGNIVGAQTTITCEQKGAWDILRRVWTTEDGTRSPMTNGSVDYDWSI